MIFLFCFLSTLFDSKYNIIEGKTQGTTYKIVYEFQQIPKQKIDSIFSLINHEFSLWDSTSVISKINANKPVQGFSKEFIEIYKLTERVHKESNRYFNTRIGPWLSYYGFYKSFKSISLKPNRKYLRDILLDENGVLKKRYKESALDFNAIAQGYTVDLISDLLESYSIKNYLIEIGGEVKAKGVNEKGEFWKIGLEDPLNQNGYYKIVQLKNTSLATSGTYRNLTGNKRTHIFNPKKLKSVDHNMLTVSVFHEKAALADAYATAFIAMGLRKTKRLSKKLNISCIALYADKQGTKVYVSYP